MSIKDTLGSPKFLKAINGWGVVFWAILTPIAYFAGWLESVTFVSVLSIWALVLGHWGAWEAARVEVKQDEQNGD